MEVLFDQRLGERKLVLHCIFKMEPGQDIQALLWSVYNERKRTGAPIERIIQRLLGLSLEQIDSAKKESGFE